MISITIATDTIDQEALRQTWDQSWPRNRNAFRHENGAAEVIDRGLDGRLQISDGERTLFRTDGEGPGESVNILGVLFSAYLALDELPEPPNTLERGFWPDSDSLFYSATSDGRMRIALTSRHWVVGTREEWRAALEGAFEQLRRWIREHASYLEEDDRLRPWIHGGPPPDLLGPFA